MIDDNMAVQQTSPDQTEITSHSIQFSYFQDVHRVLRRVLVALLGRLQSLFHGFETRRQSLLFLLQKFEFGGGDVDTSRVNHFQSSVDVVFLGLSASLNNTS